MTKKTINILFACAIASVAAGAVFQAKPKTYPVLHTESEWVQIINGSSYIRTQIRQSGIPANVAFVCDSILETHILDINKQVVAAMMADTVKTKK